MLTAAVAVALVPVMVEQVSILPTARPNDPPSAVGALAPNIAMAGDDVLLSWLEPARAGSGRRFRFARFIDGTWGDPVDIVERDDFFANWADLPSVVANADGSMVAHWLQRSGPDVYAYDVVVARSIDDGRTWRTLGPVHSDGTQTEHGFVSLVQEAADVRAFWLDGREMAAHEGGAGHGHGAGDMTLRTATINATVRDAELLDERVCECCDTSAAVTSRGPIIVYRDRGDTEVRDISIVRRVDGDWTEPSAVYDDGWRVLACPVNGPAVDARGDTVVVAWFTGAVAHGAVRVAFSTDAGERFAAPRTIDDTAPLGRVDVVLLASGEAVVSYLDTASSGGAIVLRRVAVDGRLGDPITVTTSSDARAGGFAKIAVAGSELLVVWREVGAAARIRGAAIPLVSIPTGKDPTR